MRTALQSSARKRFEWDIISIIEKLARPLALLELHFARKSFIGSRVLRKATKITAIAVSVVWFPGVALAGLSFDKLTACADIATTFYALKIFPESVRAALADSEVAGLVSGKFQLTTQTGEAFEQTLRLHVELRSGTAAGADLVPRLRELVVAALLRTNTEYRQLHRTFGPRAEPAITLHRFGTDGFAHGIKHRWTGDPS